MGPSGPPSQVSSLLGVCLTVAFKQCIPAKQLSFSSDPDCDLPCSECLQSTGPCLQANFTLLTAEAEFHLDKAPEAIRDAMNRKGGSKVMLMG